MLALAYSLGSNTTLRRLGANRRPYMQMIRPETEKTYLDSQVRAIRRSHQGKLDVVWDAVAGSGFYDKERVRFTTPRLERVFELITTKDGDFAPTIEAIDMAGDRGLASLWLDNGRWDGRWLQLALPWDESLIREFQAWLPIKTQPYGTKSALKGIRIGHDYALDLAGQIRHCVHRSMRHRLRPPVRGCGGSYYSDKASSEEEARQDVDDGQGEKF